MQIKEVNAYQKRFYLEWLIDPNSLAYNTPLIYSIQGEINEQALHKALECFVNEYDIGCRSIFKQNDTEISQLIEENVSVELDIHTCNTEDEVRKTLHAYLKHKFDLNKGPLFKFILLKLKSTPSVLILNFHHIITDATSAVCFVSLLKNLYDYFNSSVAFTSQIVNGETIPVVNKLSNEALLYWENLLVDKNLYIEVPKKIHAFKKDRSASSVYFKIDHAGYTSIRQFCKVYTCTPFILFSSILSILLNNYSGQEDIILNYPIDMRQPSQKYELGCFVNNLPLLFHFNESITLLTLIENVKSQRKAGRNFQNITLTEVVQLLRKKGQLNDENFLNVAIIEAYFDDAPITFDKLILTPMSLLEREITNELVLAYQMNSDEVRFRLDYQNGLFDSQFINDLVIEFQFLLTYLIKKPDIFLIKENLLSPQMLQRIYANTDVVDNYFSRYKDNQGVVDLFFKTTLTFPNKAAIIYKNNQITYNELCAQIKKISYVIFDFFKIDSRLNKQPLVGVYLQNKAHVSSAFLGVLAAGCAYLPIDANLPLNRVKEILIDSNVKLLVTNRVLKEELSNSEISIHYVIFEDLENLQEKVCRYTYAQHDLAYIIYTSGSTGRPKGVMVEHTSLSNVIVDFIKRLDVTSADHIMGATSVGFDIFNLELYLALCTGATLLLLDDEVKEPNLLGKILTDFQPTIIQITPALGMLLSLANWQHSPQLLRILCGGEALSQTIARELLKIASKVYQVYGPTETTIWSSCQQLLHEHEYAHIGKPISNTQFYILNAAKKLVPWGADGELYIGGVGLSRGYYQNKEMTEKKFIDFPVDIVHSQTENMRLYATGDKVRLTPQGSLLYLGRLDNQVKIRGYRIEIGEIELCLNQYNGIEQSAVQIFGETAQKYLVAFVVRDEVHAYISEESLKHYLRTHLPTYMVPEQFVFLKSFPLTRNGKIDRSALMLSQAPLDTISMGAMSHIETELLQIWQRYLQRPSISLNEHFFALGGHSLLAAQMVLDISKRYDINLNVLDLIQHPSIGELAYYITMQESKQSTHLISYELTEEFFPLSYQQKQMLFSEQHQDNNVSLYNLAVINRLHGKLNKKALHVALKTLIKRHPMLRTRFYQHEGEWMQKIIEQSFLDEEVMHIVNFTLDDKRLREVITQKFSLSEEKLFRIYLVELSQDDYLFVFIASHLIIDGWSFNILYHELSTLYEAHCNTSLIQLEMLNKNYQDYVYWQSLWSKSVEYQKALAFWSKKLQGYDGMTLALDYPMPNNRTYQGRHHYFSIDTGQYEKLKELAQSAKTTLFNILFASYAVIISRYSSKKDIIITVPMANRIPGSERLVGLFTSLVPIRLYVDENQYFLTFLEKLTKNTLEVSVHQGIPIEKIAVSIGAEQHFASNLLQVIFVLQNANDSFTLSLPGMKSDSIDLDDHLARYNLCMNVKEECNKLSFSLEYASDLYLCQRIENICNDFVNFLSQIISGEEKKILEMFMTNTELSCISPCKNEKEKSNLVSLFEKQVRQFPTNIAVKYQNNILTYQELDDKSEILAAEITEKYHALYSKNLSAGTLIGLCIERSENMIVAILAILKAGAAYVPLDPNYPQERLHFMLEDSNAALIITSSQIFNRAVLPEDTPVEKVIILGEQKCSVAKFHKKTILPEDLAYVIYTSGSTGTPKGAMLTHYNVQRLFTSTDTLFDFSEVDVWCLFHSFAFDFSVWEIWGALLHGAQLVIVPYDDSRDPHAFRQLMYKEKVTVLNQTPTAFLQLVNIEEFYSNKLSLRYIIFGGEALNLHTIQKWYTFYPNVSTKLINMYGITETTVHVTYKEISQDDLNIPFRNNIGKPLPDLRVYILDSYYNKVPIGVSGEIYIAGGGVSCGYLNHKDLTEKSFINGNALRLNESKVYKTGDMARWLFDGTIEYLGRNDHQVKIRGFRIELGEIENALLRFDYISNVFVFFDKNENILVASYVSSKKISIYELRSFIEKILPAFMIPHKFIELEQFPLTVNGKMDITKILDHDKCSHNLSNEINNVSKNSIEVKLRNIWSKILKINAIDPQANFFVLGGDSIRILEVIQLAEKENILITPQDFYQNPTLQQLVEKLASSETIAVQKELTNQVSHDDYKGITHQVNDGLLYSLTALQEGMLFHSSLSEFSTTYIDIISCFVHSRFETIPFETVLRMIVETNMVLRTNFLYTSDKFWQKINKSVEIPLSVIDLTNHSLAEQKDILNDFFALSKGKQFQYEKELLWYICIHVLDNQTFHFTLVCHHAILDGWSVGVFLTNILKNYVSILQGLKIDVKRNLYDYDSYLIQEYQIRNSLQAKNFWIAKLNNILPCLINHDSQKNHKNIIKKLNKNILTVEKDLMTSLLLFSSMHDIPLDIILFTGHLWAISCLTGRAQIVTGLATNSRMPTAEGHQMLGLFLNSTPFCIELKSKMTVLQLVKMVMNEKKNIYDYRGYPLVDILRNQKVNALFDSLFNFINFHIFDELRNIPNFAVEQSYCYEETNFALVTQAEIELMTRELKITFIYDKNAVEKAEVDYVYNAYCFFLETIAASNVNDDRWMASFTDNTLAYPKIDWMQGPAMDISDLTIMSVFEQQVQLFPDCIAVVDENDCLSYKALNERANKLAKFFIQYDGLLVGLSATREVSTVVAMLAILKAGKAYVPLDLNLPEARLRAMINDSGISVIVGKKEALNNCIWLEQMENGPQFISFDAIDATDLLKNIDVPKKMTKLAYVMYTSGSSGLPKGVMIEEGAVLRLVKTNYIKISSLDRVAQTASFSFDAATFEVWGALLSGATLVIVPPAVLLDSNAFAAFVLSQKLTILWLTARLFDQYIFAGQVACFKELNYLLVGGDTLNMETMRQILTCTEGRPKHILNGYGPTENTTFTCTHELTIDSLSNTSIPIGKPIANTEVYILDELYKILPVGHPGELYIGGKGLAVGYLNAEQLTDERFLQICIYNPFLNTCETKRLYKSLDSVRWLSSGEIEFLGRLDRTTKVNGYRVNLAEIEMLISKQHGITNCIVIESTDKTGQLIAYYSADKQIASKELRAKIESQIPYYMLPKFYIELDKFPLTANGKIDVKRLQLPQENSNTSVILDNQSNVMIKLHEVWKNVLEKEDIKLKESFFEQGGDSLLAMQLHREILEKLNCQLSIVDIFRYPSITEMSKFIEGKEIKSIVTTNNNLKIKEKRQRFKKLLSE